MRSTVRFFWVILLGASLATSAPSQEDPFAGLRTSATLERVIPPRSEWRTTGFDDLPGRAAGRAVIRRYRVPLATLVAMERESLPLDLAGYVLEEERSSDDLPGTEELSRREPAPDAPGGYLWVGGFWPRDPRRPRIFLHQFVVVAEIALAVRSGRGRARVFAFDTTTGAPVPDLEIALTVGGREVTRERTDSGGLASFRRDEQTAAQTAVLVGRRGESLAIGFAAPEPAGADESSQLFALTDHRLYRPGERVHCTLLPPAAGRAGHYPLRIVPRHAQPGGAIAPEGAGWIDAGSGAIVGTVLTTAPGADDGEYLLDGGEGSKVQVIALPLELRRRRVSLGATARAPTSRPSPASEAKHPVHPLGLAVAASAAVPGGELEVELRAQGEGARIVIAWLTLERQEILAEVSLRATEGSALVARLEVPRDLSPGGAALHVVGLVRQEGHDLRVETDHAFIDVLPAPGSPTLVAGADGTIELLATDPASVGQWIAVRGDARELAPDGEVLSPLAALRESGAAMLAAGGTLLGAATRFAAIAAIRDRDRPIRPASERRALVPGVLSRNPALFDFGHVAGSRRTGGVWSGAGRAELSAWLATGPAEAALVLYRDSAGCVQQMTATTGWVAPAPLPEPSLEPEPVEVYMPVWGARLAGGRMVLPVRALAGIKTRVRVMPYPDGASKLEAYVSDDSRGNSEAPSGLDRDELIRGAHWLSPSPWIAQRAAQWLTDGTPIPFRHPPEVSWEEPALFGAPGAAPGEVSGTPLENRPELIIEAPLAPPDWPWWVSVERLAVAPVGGPSNFTGIQVSDPDEAGLAWRSPGAGQQAGAFAVARGSFLRLELDLGALALRAPLLILWPLPLGFAAARLDPRARAMIVEAPRPLSLQVDDPAATRTQFFVEAGRAGDVTLAPPWVVFLREHGTAGLLHMEPIRLEVK